MLLLENNQLHGGDSDGASRYYTVPYHTAADRFPPTHHSEVSYSLLAIRKETARNITDTTAVCVLYLIMKFSPVYR